MAINDFNIYWYNVYQNVKLTPNKYYKINKQKHYNSQCVICFQWSVAIFNNFIYKRTKEFLLKLREKF